MRRNGIIENGIIILIKTYQYVLSPDKNILVRLGVISPKTTCIFYPTCSEYTILAIRMYGIRTGLKKGITRISRCHKGNPPSVDMP